MQGGHQEIYFCVRKKANWQKKIKNSHYNFVNTRDNDTPKIKTH